MCDKVVSKEPAMLKYCLNRCKTQRNVPALKWLMLYFIMIDRPWWYRLYTVTFFSDDMGLTTIGLCKINLNDDNFDDGDPTKRENTTQKMKFSIQDFFSKCDQIFSFLWIWSHLLKKSLMENFIFCAVKRGS